MKEYLQLLSLASNFGERRNDRTGVGTFAVFGAVLDLDVRFRFPAVTVKRLPFKGVAAELACFLRGYTRLDDFHRMGCSWWDGNANAEPWASRNPGSVGRVYGAQWRNWVSIDSGGEPNHLDQLQALVEGLRRDPHGRRHLVTAWQPGELEDMCLPPCHYAFQCFASSDGGWLDMLVHMRSVDLVLGLPCDVASYALLLHLIGHDVGRRPRRLKFCLGDAHVYLNHVDAVMAMLNRTPLKQPLLAFKRQVGIEGFHPDDVLLVEYQHHPHIEAKLNV